jgi:hypothetical protein
MDALPRLKSKALIMKAIITWATVVLFIAGVGVMLIVRGLHTARCERHFDIVNQRVVTYEEAVKRWGPPDFEIEWRNRLPVLYSEAVRDLRRTAAPDARYSVWKRQCLGSDLGVLVIATDVGHRRTFGSRAALAGWR